MIDVIFICLYYIDNQNLNYVGLFMACKDTDVPPDFGLCKQQNNITATGGFMTQWASAAFRTGTRACAVIIMLLITAIPSVTFASEDMYREFSAITRGKGDQQLFKKLNSEAGNLDWSKAKKTTFKGNLRLLKVAGATGDSAYLYMVRNVDGKLYILSIPSENASEEDKALYAGLDEMLGDKFMFTLMVAEGQSYSFARLSERPLRTKLDRIFKISIVLMLFFVMVGMGLTLTVKDFKRVFWKPRGMITGALLQWAVMPLIAVGMGRLLGFYDMFPFIFVGIVLIAVSPGGVTSNLMTFYAKGDLALSVSLTSFSTVLSLVFTPLLLALYCANVPEVTIPVGLIMQTIIILVIIPLAVGMTVQARAPKFATKATPIFSALGVVALLFLIIAGIFSNIEIFTDTERYGFKFYSAIFILTIMGMLTGVFIPKLFKISNYQTRAISLETGLRNASLAMALALLIQDYMGDFYSSMFVTSAIFGLLMYVAGFLSIWFYKKFLPVEGEPEFEMKFKTDDEVSR